MKSCPQCNLRYPDESQRCFVDNTALVALRDPRIGTTIAGRYVIEKVLGEGGMATVYRARHKHVDRPCAVKIMNPSLARDAVVRERFRREAKAAQKLAHPNIIEIFDHGDTDDGTSFLVMELLEGESLADRIEQGQIPLDEALPLAVQIARALARAHDFEVVHRDLKPENIFISLDGAGAQTIKLLDFGIARSLHDTRLTGAGEVFGTPQYMAPERITSIDAGPPADLYALGVILFEMLTQRLPFDAADIPTFFVKHMREAPPKLGAVLPGAPAEIESLIDRLLAKDPKQRPVDAHAVRGDLIAICEQLGIDPHGEMPDIESSRREPAPTLPPVAIDQWAQRLVIYEHMLTRAFGSSPPLDMAAQLSQLKKLVSIIAQLRTEGLANQRALETVEDKEREGRQRFGFAMDALGVDASTARLQVRAARAVLSKLETQAKQHAALLLEAHRDVISWEGRSAFQLPYPQLAAAYRAAADVVDRWQLVREQQVEAQRMLDEREQQVADLDFQIRELRGAMASFEQTVGAEKAALQARMLDPGQRTDQLEQELLSIAGHFSAPLRGRPELEAHFKQLESTSN